MEFGTPKGFGRESCGRSALFFGVGMDVLSQYEPAKGPYMTHAIP